jgi:serine/threonine protein kinase
MIVCSNCDVVPAPTSQPNTPCPACGEKLIIVDTTDDLIGAVIDGRFEVLAPLGKGGMGTVYRAKQLSIGREIAVKVLDRRIEKDVKAVQRFFREAKLASTLQHPNTVPVIEFGQHADGRLFLAMELVNGSTLLDTINKQGAFPLERVVAIGVQLCDALEAAHDLQIVHRDLKLENVMLLAGKRDLVKVLDFGLARSLVDPTTAMTATGLVSGTPRYMAPEVALDGAAPSPSQDMYAIGVMLAEMSIGRPLWSAPTMEMLFIKKQETESAITDVPATLRRIVRQLLSADPSARPSAGETRRMLRAIEGRASSPVKIELDNIETAPTTDIPVEVSTTPDPFAALDNAETASLDERDGPALQGEPTLPAAPPPGAIAEHDPRFSIPVEEDVPSNKLEIDSAYVAERASKLAARQSTPPPMGKVAPTLQEKQRSANRWRNLVALLVVALVAGGAYYYFFHVRAKPGVKIYGPDH